MKNYKIYGLFILASIIFGSTFLFISLGLKTGASPLFYAALRFTSAGGILLLALILSNRATVGSIAPLIYRSAFFSLFMTVGSFGCMFIAQTRVDSGFMARFDSSGPLVTAIFASLFLKKKLSYNHGIAFTLGMAGTFLIASPAVAAEPVYLGIATGSVLFYAGGNVLYPILFSNGDDPVVISALQSLTGGIILMFAALTTETVHFPMSALGPLLYLILGGSVIGHTAILILVRETGPVFASGWLYVAPLIASVLGVLILGETMNAQSILGTVLALTGVFLLSLSERHLKPAGTGDGKKV